MKRPLLTVWSLVAILGGVSPAFAAGAGPDTAFLRRYAETFRFTLGRPAAIQVAPRGEAVLFLRSKARSLVRDLYAYDPATRSERLVMSADSLLAGAEERLTPQERATRERKRLTARGIAGYQLSRDGRRLLVPLSGRLFVGDLPTRTWRELKGGGAADAPGFSPDAEQVACVRDGDLYVMDVGGGVERRLTRRDDDNVTNGLAEFVAEEEMNRHEGYWWSPDSRWIAYQRSNTREVERFHIADPGHPEKPPDVWPYPRAGGRNADVRLGVIPAAGGTTTWITWDSKRYPYLARVVWEKDAPLTILVQNRTQTEERLLAVDPATGKTTTLLVERDAAWLNLFERVPCWLARGDGFLWITERRGFPQLELRGRDGRLLRVLHAPELNLRELVHLDRAGGVAWAIAGPEPTERHLYRIPLDSQVGTPRAVTQEPGVCTATFPDEGGEVYVLDLRNLDGARRQEIRRAGGEVLAVLRSVAEEPDDLPALELVTMGRAPELRAALIRPRQFNPRARYPVILHVYGGPLAQTVLADRRAYLLDQWVADRGYLVVTIDGRGTPARGRAWERAIRGDFATLPLSDHVAGLRALAARFPEMDTSRVGIWGASFGGYFSLIALMRRPDVFHTAVSVAPVVDWRDYDTHYTERYLGLPQPQAAAYDKSSVLTYAGRLARPLLVVHGTGDDNVYFLHSLKLCDALTRKGKDYDFLPLVGQTHMLSDALQTVRLYSRLIGHFDRTLHPGR